MRPDTSTEICVLPRFAPDIELLYLENELKQLALAARVLEQTSIATENAAVQLEREESIAFEGTPYRNQFAELIEILPANTKPAFTGTSEADISEATSTVAIRRATNQKMQYGAKPDITSEFARSTHPDSRIDHKQDFISFTEAKTNGNNALAHALLAKYVVSEGDRIVSEDTPDIAALRLSIAKAYSNLGATWMRFHTVDDVDKWFTREKSLLPIDIRSRDVEFLMGIVLELFAEKSENGFVIKSENQYDNIMNVKEDLHDAKQTRNLIRKPGSINTEKMANFDEDVEELTQMILDWNTQDTDPHLRDFALTIFSRKLTGLSSKISGLLERDEDVTMAGVAATMAKMLMRSTIGRTPG